MQLLYGRDKSDYKTLSKSKKLSSAAENTLIRDYIGYEFAKNQDDYSSLEKEPYSLTYCVTKLDNYIDKEMILVCENRRDSNYLTPSKYAHARFFKINKDSFKEDFFDIFRYSFLSVDQIKEYTDDEIDEYSGYLKDIYKCNKLSEESIKSILYMLFDNYNVISSVVYVVVDENGDNYNARSLDILRQVYLNIPYFMRKIIGFNSYGTNRQEYSNRIKLVNLSRENSDFEDDYKIDLLDLNFKKIKKVCSKESQAIVDYIYSLDDIEKRKFFDELDNYKRLSKRDLYNLAVSRKNWIVNDDNQRISSWIYNLINPDELEEDSFYMMMDILKSDLNESNLNSYLRYILNKPENICINYGDKNKDLYKFLLFEDILRIDYKEDYNIQLDIDIDCICNWWETNILPLIQEKYKTSEREYIEKLKDEKDYYNNLDLHGFNSKNLAKKMEKQIEKELQNKGIFI